MENLIIKENQLYNVTEFEISKMKEILLSMKCKYKLKNVFIEKYFNESFAILTMETFYLMLNSILKVEFADIEFNTDITFKENKIYIKLFLNKFYNTDFNSLSKEQIEFIMKKMSEPEKFILENFLEKFPTTDTINNKIELFFKTILDFDDIIKKIKNNLDPNTEKNEQLSFINLSLLKELFGTNFIIIVTENKLLSEEEYEYKGN